MKVMLDEQLPVGLAAAIRRSDPRTEVLEVARSPLAGADDGTLLAAAARWGADVLITGDKSLPYQNDLSRHDLAVLVVPAVNRPALEPCYPAIVARLTTLPKRRATWLEPS